MIEQAKVHKEIEKITKQISDLLISKNKKYGNSAIEPLRALSTASAEEQILVRCDDKINRIRNQKLSGGDDEDALMDLIGYLILLKVLRNLQNEKKE